VRFTCNAAVRETNEGSGAQVPICRTAAWHYHSPSWKRLAAGDHGVAASIDAWIGALATSAAVKSGAFASVNGI
jgi:hypothetical protein